MRRILWCAFFTYGLTSYAALAQQGMSSQQMSISQNQSMLAGILQPVSGAPYQGQKVSRSVQTLSDGTVIMHETRGLIARDAQGRIREELYQVHSANVNGRQIDRQFQSATVGDPIAHTILIWTDPTTKIAMQMQLPSLPKLPITGGIVGGLDAPPPIVARRPGGDVQMLKEDAPPPSRSTSATALGISSVNIATAGPAGTSVLKDEVRTEQLGQQSIQGVLATGIRVTTTIPTGKVGNDRPIVVVHEEWRSPELKILVKTIDKDPRTGEQTMELQGLVRTDPDAALFQVPPGYTIRDMAQMLKTFSDLGKQKAQ
jgi:hypothetical protein